MPGRFETFPVVKTVHGALVGKEMQRCTFLGAPHYPRCGPRHFAMGRQVEFYMLPDDLAELEAEFKARGRRRVSGGPHARPAAPRGRELSKLETALGATLRRIHWQVPLSR